MPKSPNDKQIAEQTERWWELSKAYHEGLIKYGFASVQSCFLINGGAIIAFLTLIGSLGADLPNLLDEDNKSQIANVFFGYAGGLILAVLAYFLSYLNFSALAEGTPSPSELTNYEVEGNTDGFKFNYCMIEWSRWLAILFVLLSVSAFLYASWSASKILTSIL